MNAGSITLLGDDVQMTYTERTQKDAEHDSRAADDGAEVVDQEVHAVNEKGQTRHDGRAEDRAERKHHQPAAQFRRAFEDRVLLLEREEEITQHAEHDEHENDIVD